MLEKNRYLTILLLAGILSLSVSVAAAAGPWTANLIAGQSEIAGTVAIVVDSGNLVVTFAPSGEWQIVETHLYVETTAPVKHAPGKFTQLGESDQNLLVYTIPLGGYAGDLYIAAHAVVKKWIPIDGCGYWQEETAWGQFVPGCGQTDTNVAFDRGWGWYFVITV
jgi:hypothetical protein